MTTALKPLAQEPTTLEALVKRSSFTERFREVLGEKAPGFMSSLIAVGRSMPDVEPRSIVGAAMTAAVLDLPIDKSLGFAWIVPYREGDRKFAQFQLGVKGFVQLAQRSGCYSRMNARAVNADAFKGYDEVGEPIIDWGAIDDTKEPAGYAFAFKLTNGFSKVCYWNRKRVEAHARRYSQSFRSGKGGPWKDNFNEMAIKTVVKNELSDWGILSIEFRRGLEGDQAVKKDVDAPEMYPDNELLPLGEPEPQEAPKIVKESAPAPKMVEHEVVHRPKGPASPSVQMSSDDPPIEVLAQVAEAAATPRAGTTEEQTPQQLLEKFVVGDCGQTFDVFRAWAIDSAMIEDADSLAGFDQVPKKAAERCLRAKTGLATGLAKTAIER